MAEIVLTTLNARYAHASFGLRYLLANLPEKLAGIAEIIEFDINQRPVDLIERILLKNPRIVGIGVYIWNAEPSLQLVSQLKRLRPDLTIILGGPEVSYETDQQEICRLADYVICGEADIAFGELCDSLLNGRRPLMKIVQAELPEFGEAATKRRSDGATKGEDRGELSAPQALSAQQISPANPSVASSLRRFVPHSSLRLPYPLYTDHDLSHRVVYVEASRGCPFKCEFCLSSLDVPVRNVPIDEFLSEMQKLLDRGLKQFKFVDRTFNLNLNLSRAILQFFYDRYFDELFLHFEMIPDRLPEALRDLIAKFPPGALQFEVGIQTFNPEVEKLISRRQDHAKLEDNLRWLREKTGVHVHTDLIVGLPGEDVASFGRGFDKLVALRPQEIQVGILKRLRGTPIVRHDKEWEMIYSPQAPYEVLQTKLIDFNTMQRMKRFARYWDLVANSGNFVATREIVLHPLPPGEGRGEGVSGVSGSTVDESPLTLTLSQRERGQESPFANFLQLSDWLYTTTGQTHAISLTSLAEHLFRFCTQIQGQSPQTVAEAVWKDFQRVGRSDRPEFLRPYVAPADTREIKRLLKHAPTRQSKHLQ